MTQQHIVCLNLTLYFVPPQNGPFNLLPISGLPSLPTTPRAHTSPLIDLGPVHLSTGASKLSNRVRGATEKAGRDPMTRQ